jgi:hypothetical protein
VTDSRSFGRSRVTVFHTDVEIDIEVAVAHPITHVGDHAPGHFRMRGANLIAYAPCRLADDLYPVKHRALQQFVGVEARPVMLNVAPDPVDRGQDVRQAFTVVSHKATASARTRSRMRAFSPRGVATST